MANVPGVDTALLAKVLLATEVAWSPNQASVENDDVQSTTFDTLLAHQQTLGSDFITALEDSEKVNDVKVMWPDFCGLTAADCATDVCQGLNGVMANVKEKAYAIVSCVEAGFAIEEDKLKDSKIDKATFITKQSNNAIKRLIEKLNVKGIAFLNANAGFNAGDGDSGYAFAGGVTEVPAADYTLDLMPKIMYDMSLNRTPAAFMIDAGRLFIPYTNAKLNIGNGEGKGNAERAKLFEANFDMLGFASAGLRDRTIMVAPYSYAFLSKNYVKDRVPTYDEALGSKGMYKYSFPLPKYGIMVDAWMERVCVDGNKNRFTIKWLYKIYYDFQINPAGCDQGGGNINTGIWEYKKLPAA